MAAGGRQAVCCDWEGSADGQVLGALPPETGSLQQLPFVFAKMQVLIWNLPGRSTALPEHPSVNGLPARQSSTQESTSSRKVFTVKKAN